MMSKSKSPLVRGLRALYLLPLVCLGIGLQARTVYVPTDKDSEKIVTNEQEEATVLNVRVDGSIECGGQVYSIGQLKDIVPAHKDGEPQYTVQIIAPADVKIGIINDVKMELRKIGSLKLRYALPADQDGVTRYMAPLPPTPVGNEKYGVSQNFPGVDRENICIVRINSLDKIFFGNKPSQDDEEMLSLGKDFLREHGKETRFSFQADRGTSYGAYVHMQNLLLRIYLEVRDEKARAVYGKSLEELTPAEKSEINFMIPLSISEAEMKGKK